MKYSIGPTDIDNIRGGGLLLYDNDGCWLLYECRHNKFQWIDPGGQYCYDDGDILVTIAREFNEETYFTFRFPVDLLKDVVERGERYYKIFIKDYILLAVHINEVIRFCPVEWRQDLPNHTSDQIVESNRLKTIERNPQADGRTNFLSYTYKYFRFDSIPKASLCNWRLAKGLQSLKLKRCFPLKP
jgi:hypothetical protein